MNQYLKKYKKLPPGVIYFINSCIVTVLDFLTVLFLYKVFHVNIVLANTAGVLLGFLVGYFLAARYVFQKADSIVGFLIYFLTFLMGLIFADWLIYKGEYVLFSEMQEYFRFLFSKGLSIVVPYFFIYYIRKLLYYLLLKYHLKGRK